jgi:DNA-directed RNA polymerase specialized sigma24 family protein
MALSGWQLSPQSLERFLAALDADRDAAGERYEQLRSKLARFFEWRGCPFPEACADEAINRVMRRLDEGEAVQDVRAYCYAVARLVLLESFKRQAKELQASTEFHQPAPTDDPDDAEARVTCLRRCLGQLTADDRDLVRAYYAESGARRIAARKQLAERLGISINALRLRAFRLSDRLQACVRGCTAATASPRPEMDRR